MKKIILVAAAFITAAGIAFAASCYRYHYVLSVRCTSCHQYQTMECDRDTDTSAYDYGRYNFSNHSADCKSKSNGNVCTSITSKSPNKYEICN